MHITKGCTTYYLAALQIGAFSLSVESPTPIRTGTYLLSIYIDANNL
jgi:hypothetical protein